MFSFWAGMGTGLLGKHSGPLRKGCSAHVVAEAGHAKRGAAIRPAVERRLLRGERVLLFCHETGPPSGVAAPTMLCSASRPKQLRRVKRTDVMETPSAWDIKQGRLGCAGGG